jgi:hypothetical protein
MKDAEDEAFEQLALKQGQWEHTSGQNTSGWRKRQVAHMDMHSHPAEFVHLHRNDTIEEVAKVVEKVMIKRGDTGHDIARLVRSMKR